ncbi:hypothetical protein [Salinibacterium sp. ZJ450]|uniref:hypothetical protein n=1 Tax=Salinibacterium sp. ZJ450 TaxID=2708338 RepID=UPI0014207219|nr:hypothetical protein [Salinibacterium sp. ZJ450]
MSEHGDLAHRLEVAVDSNEKYRSRARAVATLCAAAAGALAAGLILAPAEAIPKPAQVLGLIAITLLIFATAFSLAASSASSYQAGDKASANFLHALEVWRIRTKSPRDRDLPLTYDDLIEDAAAIKNGIIRTLSWGLWSGSFAAIVLVAALIVATFLSDSSRLVTLELETSRDLASCPGLGRIFTGEVRDRDRTSSVALLPVIVSAAECGNSAGATLYLDKSSVAIGG